MRKVFVDCGAWEGNSIEHFKTLYKDWKEYEIYAFEPHPQSIKVLKRRHGKTIYREQKAISDIDGVAQFKIGYGKGAEGSSLYLDKRIVRWDNTFTHVKTIDFSKWIKDKFSKDDYIIVKMNIEGAEYKVLPKMIKDKTIDYVNKWYIDWHKEKVGVSDELHDKCFNAVESELWELDHDTSVVYTVMTDDSYSLHEPVVSYGKWKLVCFTTLDIESEHWNIVKLKQPKSLDKRKFSRRVKILHDEYLEGCVESLYLDTRFVIKKSVGKFVHGNLSGDIAFMQHNRRNCLYKEAEHLKVSGHKQIKRYRKEGMPEGFGLYAPGIMIRKHGLDDLSELMRVWWREVEKGLPRDIPALSYALWKTGYTKFNVMPFRDTYRRFIYK